MFTSEPQIEPPDIAALLDAERFAAAEAWEPDAANASDADCDEHFGGAWHDRAAQVAERDQEQLLFEWERSTRQVACWQGEQTRILAAALDHALVRGRPSAVRDDSSMAVREMATELACAAGMSDRTIERQMNDATILRDRFPATFAALRDGHFSRAHAQVIAEEGVRLSDDDARSGYEAVMLDRGAGMTAGRLRALGKSIAEQFEPTSFTERHRRARQGRRAIVRDGDDGMAEMWMQGPAVLIHGAFDRATQMARVIADAEHAASDGSDAEQRTLDQIRFDVLNDLLLTGHPTTVAAKTDGGSGVASIQAIVQISIPAATLVGGDRPAHLAGHGPVDADTARILAGSATIWDAVFTCPTTGAILAVDRRFPNEAQRRHLRARDEHCRFPGCRMPTWRSDIDHTIDHQHGGETSVRNLAHLCRRHHMLKHATAWTVEQVDDELVWKSPLGRVYTDKSPPTVRFLEPPPPPPGRNGGIVGDEPSW
ncbi:hypothetical protein GCM10009775_15000 [Microbacterium aoyamense]|uniref:HNH nuclease domain-containing protein n=1 Tax=Microbacterium aoyamense TaxID=344166 RepID=A0ABP5AVL1_9MICO|nr:DUF222 domain-containing protein [Microbacterium aoyamense]